VDPPIILTFSNFYLPGFRGGGPIRSVSGLVVQLGDEFRFKIVTADRDLGSLQPYPDAPADRWVDVGKADVRYLPQNRLTLRSLRRLINETQHDVLYLNSFFNLDFTIKPLLLRALRMVARDSRVIVAPRGEFSPGAMHLKHGKKRAFISLTKIVPFYRSCIWQATTPEEANLIRATIGRHVTVIMAELVAEGAATSNAPTRTRLPWKEPGELKVLFLSRVVRMKNIRFALDILAEVKGRVAFDIYGPIEDTAYWEECEKRARTLPPNITVTYKGAVAHELVKTTFHPYHLFFLPTLGENFGHAIREALSEGCPVLLSDRTPWRDLQRLGVGWDIPLQNVEAFRTALQSCVDMDSDRFDLMSSAARLYARQDERDFRAIEQHRQMFKHAVPTSG